MFVLSDTTVSAAYVFAAGVAPRAGGEWDSGLQSADCWRVPVHCALAERTARYVCNVSQRTNDEDHTCRMCTITTDNTAVS